MPQPPTTKQTIPTLSVNKKIRDFYLKPTDSLANRSHGSTNQPMQTTTLMTNQRLVSKADQFCCQPITQINKPTYLFLPTNLNKTNRRTNQPTNQPLLRPNRYPTPHHHPKPADQPKHKPLPCACPAARRREGGPGGRCRRRQGGPIRSEPGEMAVHETRGARASVPRAGRGQQGRREWRAW